MTLATVALLAVALATAEARPRFLAVPLDDMALLEIDAIGAEPALLRAPRRAPQLAIPAVQLAQQAQRVERSHHHHDEGHHHAHGPHVDYGAHTGHHGAFGWYADFPVKH